MQKKIYRSVSDRKISGVCAGFAEYFNIDPTIIRIIWVITSLFAFAGVVAYLVCALIIPEKPDTNIIDAE